MTLVDPSAACTVIAPTCAESDAWATALIVYGMERSLLDFGTQRTFRFTTVTNGVLGYLPSARFP